jgi:hypothetical protein
MTGADQLVTRHRRPGLMLSGVLGLFAAGALGIWALLVWTPDEDRIVPAFLIGVGAALLTLLVLFALAMPRHGWTLTPRGIEIVQRPGVPLWPARRVRLDYAELSGLDRMMAGFDTVAELRTRDGRRFRLSAPRDARGLDDPAALDPFLDRLRSLSAAAGHPLEPPQWVPGVFERGGGLALLWVMLAVSLALAGGAIWALIWGAGSVTQPGRAGAAVGVLTILPFGVGWLLTRSYRRRRQLNPVRR